jgi:hypothetical protein
MVAAPRPAPQQYGVPKETDPRAKYNSRGAAVYRDKIKAAAEGKPWTAPPVRGSKRLRCACQPGWLL